MTASRLSTPCPNLPVSRLTPNVCLDRASAAGMTKLIFRDGGADPRAPSGGKGRYHNLKQKRNQGPRYNQLVG